MNQEDFKRSLGSGITGSSKKITAVAPIMGMRRFIHEVVHQVKPLGSTTWSMIAT